MSVKPDSQPPRVRIELLKPHRHAGRDYQPGHYLELPDGKAQWLVSTGAARTAPATTPGPAAKKE